LNNGIFRKKIWNINILMGCSGIFWGAMFFFFCGRVSHPISHLWMKSAAGVHATRWRYGWRGRLLLDICMGLSICHKFYINWYNFNPGFINP
jgi:hypothetical protein